MLKIFAKLNKICFHINDNMQIYFKIFKYYVVENYRN